MGLQSLIKGGDPYTTKLTPDETKRFEQWRKTLPARLQYDNDYDLRGFWKENPDFSVSTPGQHMTDKFKKPNHPTFSDESMYFNDSTKKYAGKWTETGSEWIYTPYDPKVKRKIVEPK